MTAQNLPSPANDNPFVKHITDYHHNALNNNLIKHIPPSQHPQKAAFVLEKVQHSLSQVYGDEHAKEIAQLLGKGKNNLFLEDLAQLHQRSKTEDAYALSMAGAYLWLTVGHQHAFFLLKDNTENGSSTRDSSGNRATAHPATMLALAHIHELSNSKPDAINLYTQAIWASTHADQTCQDSIALDAIHSLCYHAIHGDHKDQAKQRLLSIIRYLPARVIRDRAANLVFNANISMITATDKNRKTMEY